MLLSPPDLSRCIDTPTSFTCIQYVNNYDGDTIKVTIPKVHPLLGDHILIRVRGVDTPELKSSNKCEHEAALLAKNYVKSLLVSSHRIDLLDVNRDKYFRIDAKVSIDGVDLTTLLLSNKYGYAYNGGSKQKIDWCTYRNTK